MAVPAETEENGPGLPLRLGLVRLVDRRLDRMGGLGGWENPLAFGELDGRREDLRLPVRPRLDEPFPHELAE